MNNIGKMNFNIFLILYATTKIFLISNSINLYNSLDIINLIHCGVIFYYNNSIYGCICLVCEFFLGLINVGFWNSMFLNQKIYTVISLLPTILIWLIAGGIYIFYHAHRMYWLRKRNQSPNKKIIVRKKKLLKEKVCSICFENVIDGYHICDNNHYFHSDCIYKWIELKGNQVKCPYCRQIGI